MGSCPRCNRGRSCGNQKDPQQTEKAQAMIADFNTIRKMPVYMGAGKTEWNNLFHARDKFNSMVASFPVWLQPIPADKFKDATSPAGKLNKNVIKRANKYKYNQQVIRDVMNIPLLDYGYPATELNDAERYTYLSRIENDLIQEHGRAVVMTPGFYWKSAQHQLAPVNPSAPELSEWMTAQFAKPPEGDPQSDAPKITEYLPGVAIGLGIFRAFFNK